MMLGRAMVETMLEIIRDKAAKPTNLVGAYVRELLAHDAEQRAIIQCLGKLEAVKKAKDWMDPL